MRENGTSTGYRGKQQLRRQRRIDLAFLLPATHRPQHHLKTLLAEAGIHMLAQNRHFADDLLHPQRREPAFFSAICASVSTIIVSASTGSCG